MPKSTLDKNAQANKLRIELMRRAQKAVQERQLTQSDAAQLMGVSQPRVSDLMRGKNEKFSLDMLVTMLQRIGVKVTLTAE